MKTIFLFKITKIQIKSFLPLIISTSMVVAILTSIFISTDIGAACFFKETQDQISEIPNHHISVSIPYVFNYSSFSPENIQSVKDSVDQELDNNDLSEFVLSEWLEYYLRVKIFDNNVSNNDEYNGGYIRPFNVNEINDNFLINGSKIPENSNEVILALPKSYHDQYFLNSTYRIASSLGSYSKFSIRVTGIIFLKSSEDFLSNENYNNYSNTLRNSLAISIEDSSRIYLLVKQTNIENFVKQVGITTGMEVNNLVEQTQIKYRYKLNSSLFKAKEVLSYIGKIKKFQDNLRNNFDDISIDISKLLSSLENFRFKTLSINLSYIIFSSPLFLISLLIQNYAKNTLESRKRNINSLLLARGVTRSYLFSELILEISSVSISSIVIGIIIGQFSLLTTNYKNFSYFIFNINSIEYFLIILIFGLFYTIYGYKNLIKEVFSQEGALENQNHNNLTENDKKSKNTKKFLTIGILFFIVLLISEHYQLFFLDFVSIEVLDSIKSTSTLFSLIFNTIGILFGIKQLFIWGTNRISSFTWPNHSNKVITLAMKNLSRFRHQYSKICMILILLIIYTSTIMIMVNSLNETYYLEAKFRINSDYGIEFQKKDELEISQYLNSNPSFFQQFTVITIAQFLYKFEGSFISGGVGSRIDLLGIDTESFFDISYKSSQFNLKPSFKEIRKSFQEDNTCMVVSFDFLEDNNVKISDSFSLNAYTNNLSQPVPKTLYPIVNATIIGSYEFFPMINKPYIYGQGVSGILPKSYLAGLVNISDTDDDIILKNYFLIQSINGIPDDQINFLKDNFEVDITSFNEVLTEIKDSNTWDLMLIVLNNNILYSMLLALIGLLIFTRLSINTRIHERAIERIIGMRRKESYYIAITEGLSIIVTSVIIGGGIGIIFSTIFLLSIYPLITPAYYAINIIITIPIIRIILYLFSQFCIFLISIIPHIMFQQKYDVGILLKKIDNNE